MSEAQDTGCIKGGHTEVEEGTLSAQVQESQNY